MQTWPVGIGRAVHDTIDSTNLEAVRQLENGAGPMWVLAHEQTAGIGRRGRAWSTTSGNFAATYLMPLRGALKDASLFSFVAALALRDALVAAGVSSDRVGLKWPNDVLLDGGKLAGILLQTAGQPTSHLCVGIGVNLVSAPPAESLDENAMTPRALGPDGGLALSPEDFLDYLAPAFALREAQLLEQGFSATRTDWLASAARLGEIITARTPTNSTSGIFETVDEDGAVILNTSDGLRSFHAADIFFEKG